MNYPDMVLKYPDPFMNSLLAILTLLWKTKENEDFFRNTIISHGVLLCVLVSRKDHKYRIWHVLLKKPSKMDYHIWTDTTFKPNDHGHDHMHGIVRDN
jgi:hypothetical protein